MCPVDGLRQSGNMLSASEKKCSVLQPCASSDSLNRYWCPRQLSFVSTEVFTHEGRYSLCLARASIGDLCPCSSHRPQVRGGAGEASKEQSTNGSIASLLLPKQTRRVSDSRPCLDTVVTFRNNRIHSVPTPIGVERKKKVYS